MQAWNGWIDKTMRRIITETADHFKEDGITFDDVVEILNCTFGGIYLCIKSHKMPTISLQGALGSFWPSPTKLLRHINRLIEHQPHKIEEISEFQKVYYRVKTQKNKRKLGK